MTSTMTECIKEKVTLPACQGRLVEAEFVEEEVTSDGGVLLLREIDRKINLTRELEKVIPDRREAALITHSLISMLKQRIYGIALGYEDLNDHTTLRNDPAIQTAVDRIDTLSSSPTLCRMENRADRKMIVDSNKLMVEKFIESHDVPPTEIILDFDATVSLSTLSSVFPPNSNHII
jgi:Transposase DDE domain group 1